MSVTDKALKIVAERPLPVVPATPPAGAAAPAVFAADRTEAAPPADPRAAFLADLALHRAVATPLCVGLFGPAGSGKSSLLEAVLDTTLQLGHTAKAAGLATPFVAGAATLHLAVQPGRDPYATLLQQAHAGLATDFPALAAEAAQSLGDPQAAAREADERLSAARHRLDEERRRLDELSARQARLVDNVLFDSTGSRVDAFARSNRGRIDRALRRFGFAGDTAVTYKELVRDAAEPGLGRGLGWASAFWAYRGQIRLLLVALAFGVAAWLVGTLLTHQEDLLGALRSSNDKMVSTADWLEAHAAWLEPIRQVLDLAALAALAMNVFRAVRFIQPLARGATLLRGDLDGRRRDLDGLVAHQAQRVETLAREVEQASSRAAEAEQRLSARSASTPATSLAGLGEPGPAAAAHGFFARIAEAIAATAGRPGSAAPARLILALDGFEALRPEEAAAFLDAAHLCFARPGFVTLLAADRDHLATGFAETDPALARAKLDRIVQVPIHLGQDGDAGWPGGRQLVQVLLRSGDAHDGAPATVPDVGRSAFDKPWLPKEAAVLEALAPFAGHTPRALKRYVNLYRIARADPGLGEAGGADLAALALGLALAGGGSLPPASLLGSGAPLNGDLQAARHAAATALGVALDLGRESRGLEVARRYAST